MSHLDWALRYAGLGWSVIPLKPGTKLPLGALVPNGLLDASKDTAVITRWWTQHPDANIGIATGCVSGFCALDVDPRHGGDDALQQMVEKRGLSLNTITNMTGGGGLQYLYKLNGGSQVRNSAGKLGPGLDVRGNGGYIVVADSIHPSGNAYEWEGSSDPFEDGHTWQDSTVLERCIAALAGTPKSNGEAADLEIGEGRRNQHLTSLAGALRRRGMGIDGMVAALNAENAARCRPPLGEAEVFGVAHSVHGYPPKETESLFDWKPITQEELSQAIVHPSALVERYLYRDVAVLAAPGGSSKTTICLWEAIHIALGIPLYGLQTTQGATLYVTSEDSRELLVATLRELMKVMDLNHSERDEVLQNVVILDLVGNPFPLCEIEKGNAITTSKVDDFITAYRGHGPGLVIFDPLVSFASSEESVNTAAQGVINASRRIMRDLGCCVRLVHHTGQVVYRDNIRDQYAPRGGSALSDGARMVAVLSRLGEAEVSPFPGDKEGVIVLSRPKLRYCQPQPDIYLRRDGYRFEYMLATKESPEERLSSKANQVHQFLTDQLKRGNKYTAKSLENILPEIGLTQRELRAAIARLRFSGRLEEREFPKEEQQGGRKFYLNPTASENSRPETR